MIIANDINREDAGFGSDKNQATLIWKDGRTEELELMEKSTLSDLIIQEAANYFKQPDLGYGM